MNRTAKVLMESNSFLLHTHVNPDGDALGSAGALCLGLRSIGKMAYIAVPDEISARLKPFVSHLIEPPEGFVPEIRIAIDTPTLNRLPARHSTELYDLKIDHHPHEVAFARHELVDAEKAACGEIIYQLLIETGIYISREIAELLYLAIASDTGCFRFSNTTSDTLRIAAALIDSGADSKSVNEAIFAAKTRQSFAIEAKLIENMEYFRDGSVAIGIITRAIIDNVGASRDDMENISSIPRSIIGVEIGAVIKEMPNKGCKISVRTGAGYKANAICHKLGGGGHDRASGAYFEKTPAEAKYALLAAIEELYPYV